MDRLLDQAATGPRYLKIAEIAILLVNALKEGEQKLFRYTLHAFVIMPNHVHLLATPNVPFTKWLAPLKGFTSYQANRILRQAGHPFWQHEGYDHLVRSEEEFVRIRRYIENNPVKAGLIATAEEYRWSSAYRGTPEKASAANSGGSRP